MGDFREIDVLRTRSHCLHQDDRDEIMTTDLEKLSTALKRDTSDKLLEHEIESHKEEIQEALNSGRDFVLEGSRPLVIKDAC
jgi:hypothetical protein